MTWDAQTARVRIGLAPDDAMRDEDLMTALDAALAAAESYCDRHFAKQADTQEVRQWPASRELLLRRYPIESLTNLRPLPPHPGPALDPAPAPSSDPVSIPSRWRMEAKRGVVHLWASAEPLSIASGFTIAYVGGYDPLPADLEAALWMIFDSLWSTTPGWGAAAGSQISAGGAVKSFAIDGMSIGYDTDATVGNAGAGDAQAWGVLPARAVGILNFYRAESAALGG